MSPRRRARRRLISRKRSLPRISSTSARGTGPCITCTGSRADSTLRLAARRRQPQYHATGTEWQPADVSGHVELAGAILAHPEHRERGREQSVACARARRQAERRDRGGKAAELLDIREL